MPALTPERDLQWPSGCLIRPAPFVRRPDPAQERELYAYIEDFFQRRLGAPVTLMPSGRAALAALLDHLGASRADLVFAPRWSSSCVWNAIGSVANPTTVLRPAPDYTLAVHKWGWRSAARGLHGSRVIEDSVDSVFLNGNDLFPLGGRYEIISLPKTIGSYCGGLVISLDASFRRAALAARRKGGPLGRQLSELKHRLYLGQLRSAPVLDTLELCNRTLDLNALRHISACLPLLDRNCETIARRLARLKTDFDAPATHTLRGRLPVVYPVRACRHSAGPRPLLQSRHFDFSRRLDLGHFEECWVLPLHFGVGDAEFERLLTSLRRLRR